MNYCQTKKYRALSLKQLHTLVSKGKPQQALLSPNLHQLPQLQCSVLTSCMFYEEACQKIQSLLELVTEDNSTKSAETINHSTKINQDRVRCWYTICLYKLGKKVISKEQMNLIKSAQCLQELKKFLYEQKERDKNNQIMRMHFTQNRIQLKQTYENLLRKATFQNYFKQPSVPAYLLSLKWVEKFYKFVTSQAEIKETNNQSLQPIPPVDNRHLAEIMPLIDTDPKYHHLNYAIKSGCREATDYKIIPYELWKFLQGKFGGIQLKRFTTPQQNKASVEVWYQRINIVIVEERHIVARGIQLLCSKFESVKSVIERVKRLIVQYQLCQFQYMKPDWEGYVAKRCPIQEFTKILQGHYLNQLNSSDSQEQSSEESFLIDQQIDQILKIPDVICDIEQCSIYTTEDLLIFNVVSKDTISQADSIFKDVGEIQTIISRPKCLSCGSPQNLTKCTCNSVYFCSKQCKMNKEHSKVCLSLIKEQNQVADLLTKYKTLKRNYVFSINSSRAGKVGFVNLGNTCYMNAALQCVLQLEDLSEYFLKNGHMKDINVSNVLGTDGHLAFSYAELVKDYFTTNMRALQPVSILRIIAKNPQFRGMNHQDSQQFLNYFLDKLHQDLNRIKKKPYVQNIQSEGRPDSVVSDLSWQNHLKRNQSFISQNLTGQYRSEIRCPDCHRISITFDPFMSVTLQFPKEEKTCEVIGYYMTPDGQFQKIDLSPKASMSSVEFCEKVFHQKVVPTNLFEKRVHSEWNMRKTVQKNSKEKGILLFYPKEQNNNVQIDIEIVKGKEVESFNRRIFVKELLNEQQLKDEIYKVIKKPLIKALNKVEELENDDQKYLQMCRQNNLVQLVGELPQFPFLADQQQGKENGEKSIKPLKVQVKINRKKQSIAVPDIKFNVSSGSYTTKLALKVRSLNDSLTIHDMIASFNQPEQLTEDNAWYCSRCKDHKLAQKIMSIYRVPKYLILHLKRFNHRGGRYVIYGQKVKTPVILQDFETINGKKYQMIGVVNHFGSLSFGHYTSYVKKSSQWYYFDDQSVKRRRVDGDNAYLVFYKMVEQQIPQTKQQPSSNENQGRAATTETTKQ